MGHRRSRWSGAEPDGEFRRLAGTALAVLFVLSGVIAIADALSLAADRPVAIRTMGGAGVAAVLAGLVMLRLPWPRWPRQASLVPIVPAFVLLGLGNWVDPDPYLAAIFYFSMAVWIGIAQPSGTTLVLSPLLAVGYWAPMALVPHIPGLVHSVPYVVAVCVMTGETLAWLTTRLHRVQRRLREHDEHRFQALLANSSDTTIVLDGAGLITYISPSAARVLRLATEDLRDHPVEIFIVRHVHPEDAAHLRSALETLRYGDGSVQFRVSRGDGTWYDIEGLGRNLLDDGIVAGLLLNLRDVSDRTRLEGALRHQAFSDQLTGLPNRALLYDRTEQALRLCGRHGHEAALLLVDLDRFKEVNDTLGHHHGDLLLQQVAERLSAAVRDSDTVARLGGDEFAVLLPQIASIDDAVAVAEKLRAAIEEPFVVAGLLLDVDASVGLAAYPLHANDPNELLQRADVAMYAAKTAHLPHAVYNPGLDPHSPRQLLLLGQLRRAVADRELVVYYQAKADARTRQVIGAEALVRWQHPRDGLLAPDEFIPLAETTGLIRPLTYYVVDVALGACRSWQNRGHELSVAVNVSARCLLDPTLPEEVERLLDVHGVPSGRLTLEITESALMADTGRTLGILERLHDLGVHVSIDDFGTGYSSMAHLKNLPVDELKVDRSFVTHMRAERSDRMIVHSTVDLGHNLGLRVVAEGVEDEETWQDLTALGCDVVQGYFLARPMPASRFTEWLGTDRSQPLIPAPGLSTLRA